MNMRTGHNLLVGTAFLILVGGVTYSCKDFLDVAPQGALDQTTLSNQAGVEGTLIAADRALDWNNAVGGAWGSAASNWVWGSVTSDDAHKGSDANDQAPIADIELYNWGTGLAEGYLNDKWRTVWEGVVRSNATLRLLKKVSGISASDAASIRGEALFLRAHYHFEAWRMWGNIPYYTEDDADYNKPNNLGVDSAAKLILRDLDTAFALLPADPRNSQAGRATKWKARAYKGRVQMYIGDYAGALATLRVVRDSNGGRFALETSFDHVWTGFKQFANGKETVLAYEASVNDGEPNGNNSNYGERLNLPHSGSPFKCCGFHQPSQNQANVFAVDGVTGLPKAFTSPATWNNRDSVWVASVSDTVDPRMDWTIGRDWVPYMDWGMHDNLWIRAPGYGGRYSPKKNAQEKASGAVSKVGWQPEQENGVHIHIFRYADLLLLDAEARVETGDVPSALTLVNLVRARAAVAAQGCGAGSSNARLVKKYPLCAGHDEIAVPLTDPTIGWATYK